MTHLPTPDHFTAAPGRISLVGAGPGAADLLTLRALRCLQGADVVFYDRLIDQDVLDLIPAGAEKVNVGKEVGRCKWPQQRIDAAIVMAALRGLSVVRLKSGDPSVFGRAAEEIDAARAHGIEVEVIPGVTAASAAAASTLRPLTERGRFDRLLMLTATALDGALPDDIARSVAPGTRLAIYMGVHLAGTLSARLIAAGVPANSPAMLCERVGTVQERSVEADLQGLAEAIAQNGIRNPAVIFVDVEAVSAAPSTARPVPTATFSS